MTIRTSLRQWMEPYEETDEENFIMRVGSTISQKKGEYLSDFLQEVPGQKPDHIKQINQQKSFKAIMWHTPTWTFGFVH